MLIIYESININTKLIKGVLYFISFDLICSLYNYSWDKIKNIENIENKHNI
jgi:hypothetical protein